MKTRMTPVTIYLLHANGDDYHGSFILGAYTRLKYAHQKIEQYQQEDRVCHECGHVHSLSTELIRVDEM